MEDLTDYVSDGLLQVRVTPKAAKNRIVVKEGIVRVYVTVVPEDGKANAMVQKLLAKELGVAKSKLELRRGAKDRVKIFAVSL